MFNNIWLDRKYIGLVSYRFEGFEWKSSQLANARCPFCGDSKRRKNLKRFYFYTRNNTFFACCKNCGYGANVKNTLKRLDYKLYQEYQLEMFHGDKDEPQIVLPEKKREINPAALEALYELRTLDRLRDDHPAKQYILDRKLPPEALKTLRWCPQFKLFTNYLIPGKFEEIVIDEGRIIIPCFDEKGKFFAYSGRSLISNDKKVKYIHIVLDFSIPFFYGMNKFDRAQKGYVLEGQFDSMFLPNALSMQGLNVSALSFFDKDKLTVVLDNEPRKRDTISRYEQTIDLGYDLCIWPGWVEEKDINKMVTDAGWTPEYIQSVIDSNTYSGLEAKIKLAQWRQL